MVAGERWGCFFARVHLALKGWLGRKLSAQVLVGLQAMGSGYLALALRLPGPCAGQTECNMAHERPCPCAGQTRAPLGPWVDQVRGADPSATWRLGLGKRPDWLWQPQRHVALGKTRAPPGAWAAPMRGADPNAT